MQITDIFYGMSVLFFSLIAFSIILNIPILTTMYFLMPQKVLDKYFRPPYFGETEVAFLTGLPFCMLRTVMFMTIFAFPHRGKVRGLTEAYLMVPTWYQHLSKFYIIALVVTMAGMIFLGVILVAYLSYTGQMEW